MRNMVKPFFNLFSKKRKSRGTMWVSLIGVGISAAVFGLTRGKRKNIIQPFQDVIQSFTPKDNMNFNNTALAEFSEELLASALRNDHKDR
ncbi:hypothetical protein QFZ31_006349 [Neobacillus niacini]|uniref:hypothetical protein n=1 Tax=Neobacillus driksii TaxID=3035913 RepID=UPI0027893F19|nr:hypothetical protein [Neobacillus niacini]MDQ0976471.1 hypothetical protein [Neobacillus niacini]